MVLEISWILTTRFKEMDYVCHETVFVLSVQAHLVLYCITSAYLDCITGDCLIRKYEYKMCLHVQVSIIKI